MHQSLDIDIAHCRSDFVQHKHNPENTKICLYMYTTVPKTLKVNIDEFADLNKLCLLDSEISIDVSRNFVARLYDQKGKMRTRRFAFTCTQQIFQKI
jgi:hypothetical protein